MLAIDETSRGVVERLRDMIIYSSFFTRGELAYLLREIIKAWVSKKVDNQQARLHARMCITHATDLLDLWDDVEDEDARR